MTLDGNRFVDITQILVALNLVARGNFWVGNDVRLGYAACERAAFTGNLIEHSREHSRFEVTAGQEQLEAVGNVRLDVESMWLVVYQSTTDVNFLYIRT